MAKVFGKIEIIEKLKSKEVIDFIDKYDITTIIMFGSITNNEFNQESDIDLALLANSQIALDNILEIELFLEEFTNRQIDVLDLKCEILDLFIKINVLNTGKVIYTKDNGKSLGILYNETDKIYKENENFIHFRKVDVLS